MIDKSNSETNKNRNKMPICMKSMKLTIAFLLVSFILVSCAPVKDYNYAMSEFNKTIGKYNSTLENLPDTTKELESLRLELKSMQLGLDKDADAFKHLVGYTMLVLEAEESKIRGESYGAIGTASDGFGCKQRPLIYESADFRNESAQKGFESLAILKEFLEKYPNEANSAGLGNRIIIFKNGYYVRLANDAKSDKGIVNKLCPVNRTLEIYKEGFKKTLNMTDDEISKLTYEQAVEIYKQQRYDKAEVFT